MSDGEIPWSNRKRSRPTGELTRRMIIILLSKVFQFKFMIDLLAKHRVKLLSSDFTSKMK